MTQATPSRSILAKPSWRRYMLRFSIAMAAYVAVLGAVDASIRAGLAPGQPWI